MTRALEDAWRCGTRALRTHIDWPDPLPPLSLPVLLELREVWRGRIALQFVSLTPLDAFDAEGAAWERARLLSELGGVLGVFAYRNAELGTQAAARLRVGRGARTGARPARGRRA